jgi:hypothetical protein
MKNLFGLIAESILIRLFCQISPPGPQNEWIQYKTQVSIGGY